MGKFDIIDAMFRCIHERYTWPQRDAGGTYVVCIKCGKEFTYDIATMERGGARRRAVAVAV